MGIKRYEFLDVMETLTFHQVFDAIHEELAAKNSILVTSLDPKR
jgi:hypothetical protein